LKKNQVAEVFDQKKGSQRLFFLIERMINNLSFYKGNFKKLTKLYQGGAAKKIIEKVL